MAEDKESTCMFTAEEYSDENRTEQTQTADDYNNSAIDNTLTLDCHHSQVKPSSDFNPFSILFTNTISLDDVVPSVKSIPPTDYDTESEKAPRDDSADAQLINNFIEKVFLFTVCDRDTIEQRQSLTNKNSNHNKYLILLSQLRDTLHDGGDSKMYHLIDFDHLQEAIFERLLLQYPRDHLITPLLQQTVEEETKEKRYGVKINNESSDSNESKEAAATESNVIVYLFNCYRRLTDQYKYTQQQVNAKSISTSSHNNSLLLPPEWSKKCAEKIFTNCLTCLLAPSELYYGQNCAQQFVQIFTSNFGVFSSNLIDSDSGVVCQQFMCEFVDFVQSNGESNLEEVFYPIFNVASSKISEIDVTTSGSITVYIDFILSLLKDENMCLLFMKYISVQEGASNTSGSTAIGKRYEQTLLGVILTKSTIVAENSPTQFFRPSQSGKAEIERQENNLKVNVEKVYSSAFTLIKRVLTYRSCSDKFHCWLASCIVANKDRTTLRGTSAPDEVTSNEFCSDGFFLNLLSLCLKLLHKFVQQHPSTPQKVFRIDPTYCKMVVPDSESERDSTGVHWNVRDTETFITSLPEDAIPVGVRPPYEPLTEMFFLTHKIFHLAFHRINAKLHELLNHLRRLEQARHNSSNQSTWLLKFDRAVSRFFSMRVALNEPQFTTMAIDFLKTSAVMLCHYTRTNERDAESTLLKRPPQVFIDESVQLRLLSCFPEIIVQNISDFIMYNRRFNEGEMDPSVLSDFQSFFITFMPYKERITNPHLRAKLAECLELTLAHDDFESRNKNLIAPSRVLDGKKAEGFKSMVLKKEASFALIKLFVDIEQCVSGDEIHFEQKFSYRRPMIKMLEIMWTVDEYKDSIEKLAREAVENIEAANVPVFVRFINLLLNDSIFLLDEAMQYITQIRNMDREREAGEWSRLGLGAMQREANLRHIVNMAKFHSIMATDIVQTLRFITTSIKDLFVHPTFVDRVASMLNYFLKKLVGSERTNLAVNQNRLVEIQFKAKKLVKDICYIYMNLSQTHNEQMSNAIARDARSYSSDLFSSAVEVLYKISTSRDEVEGEVTSELIENIQSLSQSVALAFNQQKVDEEEIVDAPDEFLDPIMSILMKDPVILPSSQATVDRSTIARHLLSDQSDPFNRQPLTMDQVKPNEELKQRIQSWLKTNAINNQSNNKTALCDANVISMTNSSSQPQSTAETPQTSSSLSPSQPPSLDASECDRSESFVRSGSSNHSEDSRQLTIDYSPLDNLD